MTAGRARLLPDGTIVIGWIELRSVSAPRSLLDHQIHLSQLTGGKPEGHHLSDAHHHVPGNHLHTGGGNLARNPVLSRCALISSSVLDWSCRKKIVSITRSGSGFFSAWPAGGAALSNNGSNARHPRLLIAASF